MGKLPVELDDTNLLRKQEFEKHYTLQHALDVSVTKKTTIAYSQNVKCRFCKKSQPEVTFKKDSHLIPQGLGNRYLVTNFECDECNAHFSKYENSFASFFSLYRPFAGIKNHNKKKDKNVKHKEANITFRQDGIGKIEYEVHQNRERVVSIDEAKKNITFNTQIPPYVPLEVYKVLVKIGLSLIEDYQMPVFERAFMFLIGTHDDRIFRGNIYGQVIGYSVPGPILWDKPKVALFSKKIEFKDSWYPHMVLIFCFMNHLYQIHLPMNATDNHIIPNMPIFLRYPLILDKSHFEKYGLPSTLNIDFTSDEKQTGNTISTTLTYEEKVQRKPKV